ncbi:unnamed protein product [Mytilus coruscus]|uniref:BEN domain-containing protein n=1 Tax=Mytilus coruscus TaxID=42192 RepID=A0A6J8EXM1_MYTCO|nr:unnamed protein product [Mytilus coruscus]
MSSRAATLLRVFSLLKKNDDGILYTCPRIKIMTEGRVRVGSRYPVMYGNSTSSPESAEMKNRETENSEVTSPTLHRHTHNQASPVASPFVIYVNKRKKMPKTTTSKKPRQEAVLLSMEEGIHDPYAYRSPSISPQLPLHLEAPSPTSPIVPTPSPNDKCNQTSPTETEPTAFTIQKTMAAIYKQLEINNARQTEMERIILSQQQKIDYLVAMQRQQSFRLTAPPTPTTPRTPTCHQRQLPDFDTPTRDERPDTPVTPSIPPVMPLILPTTPTAPTTIRSVPMHLFADIPDGVRLSENDLNQAASSSTTPGAFAVSLLKYLFQELFTTDNLRVYFSYRGGGKLSKRPLDDTRKQYLRRYVTAFYPSVTSESAYAAMVIEKINQFLRRPIQQKK